MTEINPLFAIIFVGATFVGATAAFFLKRASVHTSIKVLLCDKNLYIGAALYLCCAVVNIILLRYLEYSVVLPMTALTYVWTMIIAYFFLKERITFRKIWGIVAIVIGVILISVSP